MAIRTDKSIFYHIPKTGGVWVKETMRRAGLEYGRCRDKPVSHPFRLKREHATPAVVRDEDKAGRFSFCFVRRPVSWYRSFWCYRIKTDTVGQKFPLDLMWDDEFEPFVRNVLAACPNGFVTKLYQFYVDDVDFVGRQENLRGDLVRALTLAGEQFDENAIRNTRRFNMSATSKRFIGKCELSAETRARVQKTEAWVLERFYRD